MSNNQTSTAVQAGTGYKNRWMQLIIGIVCMGFVANLQYGWTLFVTPMDNAHHWGKAAIQLAFSIFIVTETWLVPIEGYLVDKFGPRPVVAGGAVCAGLGWIIYSFASSLPMLYAGAVVSGIGAGCVYGTCVGNALKWFPDRRGLAVGLTAGGYGAGSAATILPIAAMIKTSGFQETFLFFGILQGSLAFLAAWFLRSPAKGEVSASAKLVQAARDYTLKEALNTKLFWLMFFMFICVVTGGMMAVAQLGVIAQDLGVKEFEVDMYFFVMAALPLALMLDRIMNGISRPLFGWISDNIGREKTMVIAFTLEGFGIIALGYFGHNPWAFLILSGVVFLAWGEVYSLFSALAGDAFGTKHIGKIYGVLYTAKGIGALFVPVGNLMMEATGTWSTVLYTVACMDLTAAILAVVALRPTLKKHVAYSADLLKKEKAAEAAGGGAPAHA